MTGKKPRWVPLRAVVAIQAELIAEQPVFAESSGQDRAAAPELRDIGTTRC